MANGSNDSSIRLGFGNATLSITGIYTIIIVILLLGMGVHAYIMYSHTDARFDEMIRRFNLIYAELRIQTQIMAMPEWQRPKISTSPQIKEEIEERLEGKVKEFPAYP